MNNPFESPRSSEQGVSAPQDNALSQADSLKLLRVGLSLALAGVVATTIASLVTSGASILSNWPGALELISLELFELALFIDQLGGVSLFLGMAIGAAAGPTGKSRAIISIAIVLRIVCFLGDHTLQLSEWFDLSFDFVFAASRLAVAFEIGSLVFYLLFLRSAMPWAVSPRCSRGMNNVIIVSVVICCMPVLKIASSHFKSDGPLFLTVAITSVAALPFVLGANAAVVLAVRRASASVSVGCDESQDAYQNE